MQRIKMREREERTRLND